MQHCPLSQKMTAGVGPVSGQHWLSAVQPVAWVMTQQRLFAQALPAPQQLPAAEQLPPSATQQMSLLQVKFGLPVGLLPQQLLSVVPQPAWLLSTQHLPETQ